MYTQKRYFRLIVMFLFVTLPLLGVLLWQINEGWSDAAATAPEANPLGQTYVPSATITLHPDYHTATSMLYDLPRQRIYIASLGDLLSINIINQTVTDVSHIPSYVGDLAFQDDGEVLYALSSYAGVSKIYRLDPDNWSVINNYVVPEAGNFELVNGRIFLPSQSQNALLVLDAVTGAVQQTLPLAIGEYVTEPIASPDGNLLFTHGQSTIQKYDISTTPITLTLNINGGSYISEMAIAQDGSYLLASRYPDDSVTRYRTSDLSVIDVILPPTGGSLRDIATGDGVIYLVYIVDKPLLRVIDETTGQEVRSYSPVQSRPSYFGKVMEMDNGRVSLHTSGSSAGNELYVLSPADYGLVLPIVYYDYCAGPYIDYFNDPNSGWPVGTSGTITYRYTNGEYSILHAQANRWTGVTAGHTLEFARLVGFDTRIVNYQDGILGLIYGLNSDWSDFYTFEIWPSEQLWIHYHYTAAAGWQLIQYGQSPSINAQGHNQLQAYRFPGSPNLSLGINYSSTYFPPYVPGRFGFSAAAFENNVDFRYDNYKFVAMGCEQYTAQPDQVTSSPITLPPRPSLNELLDQLPE